VIIYKVNINLKCFPSQGLLKNVGKIVGLSLSYQMNKKLILKISGMSL